MVDCGERLNNDAIGDPTRERESGIRNRRLLMVDAQ